MDTNFYFESGKWSYWTLNQSYWKDFDCMWFYSWKIYVQPPGKIFNCQIYFSLFISLYCKLNFLWMFLLSNLFYIILNRIFSLLAVGHLIYFLYFITCSYMLILSFASTKTRWQLLCSRWKLIPGVIDKESDSGLR